MDLYTATGDFKAKNIIENFDEDISKDICFTKDKNKICINFNELNIILEKYNINEQLEKKINTNFDYSLDSGKYIPGKSSLLFPNTNVNDCKKYCNEEFWCKSFSFNYKNSNCLISNITKANNEFLPNYNINYFEKLK